MNFRRTSASLMGCGEDSPAYGSGAFYSNQHVLPVRPAAGARSSRVPAATNRFPAVHHIPKGRSGVAAHLMHPQSAAHQWCSEGEMPTATGTFGTPQIAPRSPHPA